MEYHNSRELLTIYTPWNSFVMSLPLCVHGLSLSLSEGRKKKGREGGRKEGERGKENSEGQKVCPRGEKGPGLEEFVKI